MSTGRTNYQYYQAIKDRDLNALKQHFSLLKKPWSESENRQMLTDLSHALEDFQESDELSPYYQTMIESGMRASWSGQEGVTYLHYAIKAARMELLNWLLKAHDITTALNVKNADGLTPLMYAIEQNQPAMMFVISERCRELGVKSVVTASPVKIESQPVTTAASSQVAPSNRNVYQFYDAIEKRDLNALKSHIAAAGTPLNDHQNLKIISDLYGAIKDFGDQAELHPYYQTIIDARVRVSCIDPRDHVTYVDYAITYSRATILRWFLKAHDVAAALEVRNPEGLVPLEHAIQEGQEDVIAALKDKYEEIGIDWPVTAPASQAKPSKLIDFIKANDLEKLFEERIAKINYEVPFVSTYNDEVRDAVLYCIQSKYNENLKSALTKLLKNASWTPYVFSYNRESFIHIAARSGNIKILECFFDINKDFAKKYLNQYYNGQTVGDIALASHNQEIIKLITPYSPEFSNQTEKKSDTHEDQRSLLTQHVLNKKNDILKSVLERMPELAKQEIADSKGHGLTAVECAFLEKNYKAAVLLFNAGQPIDRAMAMVALDQLMQWKDSNTDNDANFKIKLLSAKKHDYSDQGKLLLDDIVNNRLNKAEITLLVKDARRQIKERLFELLTVHYSPQEQLKMLSDSLEGKNGLHTVWNTKRGLRSVSSSTGVLKHVINKVLKLQSKIAESQAEKTPASLSSLVVLEPSAPTEAVVDSVTVSSEVSEPGCQIDHAPCGDFVGQLERAPSVERNMSETVSVTRTARFFPIVEQLASETSKQEVLVDQVEERVATSQKEEDHVQSRKVVML